MYEQNENPWNDSQNQQNQQEPFRRNPAPGNASNGLAVAALICSILSIVSVCCLYGAFVFGGLAIIFALLSRGSRKKAAGTGSYRIVAGHRRCSHQCSDHNRKFLSLSVVSMVGFDKFLERYTYTLEHNFGIDLNPNGSDSNTDNGNNNSGSDSNF